MFKKLPGCGKALGVAHCDEQEGILSEEIPLSPFRTGGLTLLCEGLFQTEYANSIVENIRAYLYVGVHECHSRYLVLRTHGFACHPLVEKHSHRQEAGRKLTFTQS